MKNVLLAFCFVSADGSAGGTNDDTDSDIDSICVYALNSDVNFSHSTFDDETKIKKHFCCCRRCLLFF